MKVRRCKVLYLEPREEVGFDLEMLLAGGNGLHRELGWIALAPHLGVEIGVDAAECELLGSLSPDEWVDSGTLPGDGALKSLLKKGLVIGTGKRHAAHRQCDGA